MPTLLRFLALTAAWLWAIAADFSTVSTVALIAVALVVGAYELDVIRDRHVTAPDQKEI